MLACLSILVISMPSAEIVHLVLGILFSKMIEEMKFPCISKMQTRRHMMEIHKITNGIATVSHRVWYTFTQQSSEGKRQKYLK